MNPFIPLQDLLAGDVIKYAGQEWTVVYNPGQIDRIGEGMIWQAVIRRGEEETSIFGGEVEVVRRAPLPMPSLVEAKYVGVVKITRQDGSILYLEIEEARDVYAALAGLSWP